MKTRLLPAFGALAALGATASAQLHNEFVQGDLPGSSPAAPTYVVSAGCTLLARGLEGSGTPDLDFITFVVPFAATSLVVDLDLSIQQNGNPLLGVGPGGGPMTWLNDDDFDVAADAICGVATNPRDGLIDLVAILGGPIAPGTPFTVGITRSGDTGFGGVVSNGFEYDLWVYAQGVPTPASAVLLLVAAGLNGRRRR